MRSNNFEWNSNIWPADMLEAFEGYGTNCSFGDAAADNRRINHRSFSIGFFGFHYIRAANENEPLLQQESLQILRKLLSETALNLDRIFPDFLRGRSYSEFWEKVIRKISLSLGDSQGIQVQGTVEFGFWLAAVYAFLVGVLEENYPRESKEQLGILQRWMSGLLDFAQEFGLSEMLIEPLVKSERVLRRSKTRSTALYCMRILELAQRDFLLPQTVPIRRG